MPVAAQDSTQPTSNDQSETALLLNYLQTHDVACPLCKYNLRGLVVPRCPECGKEIHLTVGLADVRLAPFIALLLALLLPAGVGILGYISMATQGLQSYRFESLPRALESLSLIGFQAAIIPPVFAVLLRRRFLRLSFGHQWTVAIMAMAEPVLFFGMLIAAIVMRPW